ncbi:DNA repair protein RadA [Bacteriovorax sp. BSW11_IV]|uniref:DNA repair protein RadA n=1 Tax=Bacteriovorax sp. BSW11_IV TaxID=1353529 RepID=UPI00038A421C|nr:DNA repair protein RadA [Bacteriovorax sp. BSW11_IV]EQC50000.1 DNA repair protein RadA [Bacteriovorax sp. BSW11_IV]
MAKKKSTVFTCNNCGHQTAKWLGRCPDCGEWNSFEEELFTKQTVNITNSSVIGRSEPPKLISEVEKSVYERVKTGIGEFDRVVGGGIVKGSLLLIGGEPGIGKSTLLTELMAKLSDLKSGNVLYVSGEESVNQIADRCKRIGVDESNFYIYNETSWQKIQEQIHKIKPRFMVLDSIQTTTSSEIQSAPGTVSQIREVTYELMNHVKSNGITCFVIGHITKDGAIAGPKILEHMVDTVIYFEGDQFGQYRMLRAIKNRFGNTNEVGIFEMGEGGLIEVKNPSQYFLDEHLEGSFGRSLSCVIEGSRTLFIEVQSLVVENKYGNGRRTTQGIDTNRLAMLVAVIEKYMGIPLGFNDIYLNVVGNMKLTTRESDLSVIASLLSSYRAKPVDGGTVFVGEVGLTGEVRSVPRMEMRLKELAQLNYKKVVTSAKVASEFKGKYSLDIIGIKRVQELDKLL